MYFKNEKNMYIKKNKKNLPPTLNTLKTNITAMPAKSPKTITIINNKKHGRLVFDDPCSVFGDRALSTRVLSVLSGTGFERSIGSNVAKTSSFLPSLITQILGETGSGLDSGSEL